MNKRTEIGNQLKQLYNWQFKAINYNKGNMPSVQKLYIMNINNQSFIINIKSKVRRIRRIIDTITRIMLFLNVIGLIMKSGAFYTI